MTKTWAAKIRAAQLLKTIDIAGKAYERLAYGPDGMAEANVTCRDCGVERGQLHVPNCCIEQCPRCGGQALDHTCHDLP